MTQPLRDLKREVETLGLQVALSADKAPYLRVLRNHYLQRDFPNGLPYQELSPMLAYNFWALKEREQRQLWSNSNWLAQEKINGIRLILHFVKNLGVFAHSRRISERSYRRVELSTYLPFSNFIPDFSATVDSEITSPGDLEQTTALIHCSPELSARRQTDNPLTIHAFDVVSWEGQDLKPRKLSERLTYLSHFHEALIRGHLTKHFSFPPVFHRGKEAVYERLIQGGAEGILFKNVNFPYIDTGARSRFGWVKLKKEIEVVGYVSGFERGRPGSSWSNHVSALEFSVDTQEGPIVIAKVSNLQWPFRKQISIFERTTGSLDLEPELYGAVAELAGLEFSRKVHRLVHPRILRWRPDLNRTQCDFDTQDLRQGTIVRKISEV